MRIKKRTIKIIFGLVILVLLAYFFLPTFFKHEPVYRVEGSTFYYSQTRPTPKPQILGSETNDSVTITKLKFPTRNFLQYNTTIYALLFTPQGKQNLPGIVVLPGGGVKKEQWIPLASEIAKQGYALLVVDQRGIGETGGYYLSIEQDFQVFSKGQEPVQHLSVYDALAAFDVLKSRKEVDSKRIVFLGESMGGRYALIATALEKRARGVILISASGFDVPLNPSDTTNNYLRSIDPDHYVSLISPRSLYMLQGNNDSVTPLTAAQHTFSLAKEPKYFFIADGCGHGFCEKMHQHLYDALNEIRK